MQPVLSPAELLGLSGATLDSRVRRAAHEVSDASLLRIAERLRADALANGIVYERDGEREPVRVMLRPLLAMPEQLSYVHHVCLSLAEALKRIPQLYHDDLAIRRILAIAPEEERWFRDTWTPAHQRLNPVYGRLDAVCDFTGAGWQESLQFMEPNLSGVGGIYFAPLAEQLVMRHVVPVLLAHDSGLAIELPRDQRVLFLQLLMDHARAIGRASCQLCLVEPKYVHDGPNEQSALSRFLAETHGLVIAHADPRELRVEGDEVFYEDVRVDVVYRDYELRELVALERELGRPLDAMRLMFRQNRVVSSIVGDFDHKSCWEMLTDASIAERYFSSDECRLFRRHVLWTRVVGDRRTTLPHGREGDLLEYARQHREQLVLKPNRGYGGKGVVLGAAAASGEWEALLDEANGFSQDPENSWVVQLATRLPVHEFPVVGADKRVFGEPFHAVMGFAPTENGLGVLCRVSQKQVVNVAQHGGLAALLVAHPPSELRMPKRSLGRGAEAGASLRAQIAELRHLDQSIGLLDWDEETMLPLAGRRQRGEQLATLEGLRHTLLISDRLGDLVEEVAAQHPYDVAWHRELTLIRRLRRSAMALPEGLVRAFANAKSQSLGAWEEARAGSDFSVFAAPFEHLMVLVRERAQALSKGVEPYDALLDEYEHGMTRSRLEPVLAGLRERLVPLVRQTSENAAAEAKSVAGRRFGETGQWELCRRMLKAIGFDFDRGRLDGSTHPFTLQAGVDDVRLTIRLREDDLSAAVMATLHEGGHGLYDQGFLATDRDSLLGEGPSMGLHESQSRLWENHVGRSLAFWQHWFPAIQALFPEATAGLNAEAFHRTVNVVRPGANRVGADEMSYHLHILLRYELELALISGALPPRDLPAAWNERSADLIGVRPASDREGILQDVHWSLGMFGYFPTYTLGSLYAAQFAEAYERDHLLEEEIRRGEFTGLLAWLRRNVHQVGHRHSAEKIVTRVTGKGLDAAAFFRHVVAKSAIR
jgi:carboxypeptidase Taq